MKNTSACARSITKSLFILGLLVYGSAFSPCPAQSIVGKWKLVSLKESITDKSSGKKQDISEQAAAMLKVMEIYIDFRADHTLTNTVGMVGSKPTVDKGEYVLSGDRLTLSTEMAKAYRQAGKGINPDNGIGTLPNYTTVRFSGGNLIMRYSGEITDDGKAFAFDMENMYVRQ